MYLLPPWPPFPNPNRLCRGTRRGLGREEAIQIFYRTPDGQVKERLLGRSDEENISITTVEIPWSFDGDVESFKLSVGAKRIRMEIAGYAQPGWTGWPQAI